MFRAWGGPKAWALIGHRLDSYRRRWPIWRLFTVSDGEVTLISRDTSALFVLVPGDAIADMRRGDRSHRDSFIGRHLKFPTIEGATDENDLLPHRFLSFTISRSGLEPNWAPPTP